jgi:hypothetical protein
LRINIQSVPSSTIEEVKQKAIDRAIISGYQPVRNLIIFNDNINNLAALWVYQRRSLYQAWPIITADQYLLTLEQEGDEFYRQGGFEDFYFIQNTDKVLLNVTNRISTAGNQLEENLMEKGVEPRFIKNNQAEDAFLVYHFN